MAKKPTQRTITTEPRLSKDLAACVSFARFCAEHGCEPRKLAKLIQVARRSKLAWENNNGRHAEYCRQAEEIGSELGFVLDWPGLWPTLSKGGYDYYLPDV